MTSRHGQGQASAHGVADPVCVGDLQVTHLICQLVDAAVEAGCRSRAEAVSRQVRRQQVGSEQRRQRGPVLTSACESV